MPGLYSQCQKGSHGAVEVTIALSSGRRRTGWMKREEMFEREVASALRINALRNDEMFICDLCMQPSRAVAISDDIARCPDCSLRSSLGES